MLLCYQDEGFHQNAGILVAAAAFTFTTSPSISPLGVSALRTRGGATSCSLPSTTTLAAAAALPTCLGLWRTGYTVSYGYGGAMTASGAAMMLCAETILAKAHAAAFIFYGLRLNLFLLYRELTLPVDVHQMKRREASLAARLKRAPVIIGCSLLYYLMAAPLRVTALAPGGHAAATAAVAVTFVGFGVAATGDIMKTVVKAREGKDFLVTGGPFRWLRHPNYSGELVGWTASVMASILAAVASGASFARTVAAWLVGAMLGWVGILFVLAGEATAGLEKKQRAKYGGTEKYEAWVKRSWAGPMLAIGASGST